MRFQSYSGYGSACRENPRDIPGCFFMSKGLSSHDKSELEFAIENSEA